LVDSNRIGCVYVYALWVQGEFAQYIILYKAIGPVSHQKQVGGYAMLETETVSGSRGGWAVSAEGLSATTESKHAAYVEESIGMSRPSEELDFHVFLPSKNMSCSVE
jgi:hypothetical protein